MTYDLVVFVMFWYTKTLVRVVSFYLLLFFFVVRHISLSCVEDTVTLLYHYGISFPLVSTEWQTLHVLIFYKSIIVSFSYFVSVRFLYY